MPTGGEHVLGLGGALADEDPCVTFRRGLWERAEKGRVYQPDWAAATVANAAIDEFRVWLERHNTELRQQIARGVAAEWERIRREIHDEGALATYTAMDVELRLDAAAAEIHARLSGEDRS